MRCVSGISGLMLCILCVASCGKEKPQAAATAEQPSLDQVDVEKPDRAVSSSSVETTATPALKITQVRADRFTFDPKEGESATIRFHIDEAAEVRLAIYDGRDRLVRVINGAELAPGDHRLSWDGRDHKGRVVPAEAYSYTLTAVADDGSVTHDLTDLSGGEALEVKKVRWDPATKRVYYYLDKPARVNIRFGLKDGGPYLRTLIDWVPRTAGPQSEAWDGWDASQVLQLAGHPQLATSVMAYSLPDNTLLVGQKPDRVEFAKLADQPLRERKPRQGPKRMYYHADQPLETRGDVTTTLAIQSEAEQDAEGRWVVSGRVPVRLNVAEEDRARVLRRRFEPVFFVDGIYAFENEVGFLPMTWNWDTSTINEGEHFVTVNVRGYDGNFGTATLKVWVEHVEQERAGGSR